MNQPAKHQDDDEQPPPDEPVPDHETLHVIDDDDADDIERFDGDPAGDWLSRPGRGPRRRPDEWHKALSPAMAIRLLALLVLVLVAVALLRR